MCIRDRFKRLDRRQIDVLAGLPEIIVALHRQPAFGRALILNLRRCMESLHLNVALLLAGLPEVILCLLVEPALGRRVEGDG